MKVFKLERTQVLPISIDKAWDFFSDPLNLAVITPPSLSFKIKGNFNGKTVEGMLIAYTVKPLLGISMDWVSEIKYVRAPHYFVDEQRVGPYKLWYHEHMFNAIGDNKVEIKDVVHYALPFGPFGILLNACLIQYQLKTIFDFRQKVLQERFK